MLRQVEGFHEEIADLTSHRGDEPTHGPYPSDRVVDAVEGAALRGFRMGIELATRRPIDLARLREIDAAAQEFLS